MHKMEGGESGRWKEGLREMWSRRQRGNGVVGNGERREWKDGVECSVSVEGKEEVVAVEVVVGSGDGLVPRAERL